MRKVVAYGDMESLMSSDLYKTIKGDLHIAESANMMNMLRGREFFDNVHLFGDILREIDHNWSREEQRIRCLALISECLRI